VRHRCDQRKVQTDSRRISARQIDRAARGAAEFCSTFWSALPRLNTGGLDARGPPSSSADRERWSTYAQKRCSSATSYFPVICSNDTPVHARVSNLCLFGCGSLDLMIRPFWFPLFVSNLIAALENRNALARIRAESGVPPPVRCPGQLTALSRTSDTICSPEQVGGTEPNLPVLTQPGSRRRPRST